MTDIYERLADENEPAPPTAPAAQLTGDQASDLKTGHVTAHGMPGIHVLSEVGVRRLEVPRAQVEKPENGREREQCDRGHQAPVLQYCEQSVDRCHRRPPTIMTIAPMSHSAKM